MISVLMYPHVDDLQPSPTAGISQVVKHYFKHLPDHGIRLLPKGSQTADLIAIHAASATVADVAVPVVSHCHGLYWTADDKLPPWTDEMNALVIATIRRASSVSVPSHWVAETFRRDMHISPWVIPHGVEWRDWQGGTDEGYVLWNKNRATDACDPSPVNELAKRAKHTRFLSTYAAPDPPRNMKVVGTVKHSAMRKMIKECSVYLATTKETFGIGTLEAMAAGKPILGFDYGGTGELIKHGYSGYLARPFDYDDLARGLDYCLKHRQALGRNAANSAIDYSWERATEIVATQYALTFSEFAKPQEVAVVIPLYNKAGTVLRAIRSAIAQTREPHSIIVVNNNSTDDYGPQIEQGMAEAQAAGIPFVFVNEEKQGVAHARNLGIAYAGSAKLICCLDADDEMLPEFIEEVRAPLVRDPSLGISFSKLEAISPGGQRHVSAWPDGYDLAGSIKGRNQVPTCCIFRREAWARAGGYRQRYAPGGAGSEDADLWLRIGLLGYGGTMATNKPLFRYYAGGATSQAGYREVDWRGDKAWLASYELPFAATAKPKKGAAHAVNQYDQPQVSVIIPVGPGHLDTVQDAIDSVEAQGYRKWEVVVVADCQMESVAEQHLWSRLATAYPFANFTRVPQAPKGAGAARNHGAALARAPLILFLDADDWLTPNALQILMDAHLDNPAAIIYGDYIGHAFVDNTQELQRLQRADRLLHYDDKTKLARIAYSAFDFDRERAQRQPEVGKAPYIWNIITSLVSRQDHIDIGGFDEQMASWEDWDYWVRLAKAGKCFCRVNQPLLEYRFFTGTRRTLANPHESGESGRQLSNHLLDYMQEKYKGIQNMSPGCSSCGGRRRAAPQSMQVSSLQREASLMASDEMVEVELVDGNMGDHLIAFQGTSYGYRSHGDRFTMLRKHAAVDRRVRLVDEDRQPAAARTPLRSVPPPPPPSVDDGDAGRGALSPNDVPQSRPYTVENIGPHNPSSQEPLRVVVEAEGSRLVEDDEAVTSESSGPPSGQRSSGSTDDPRAKTYDYDLTSLWGIDEDRATLLKERGVRSPDGIVQLGARGVERMLGASETVAKRIVAEAEKAVDDSKKSSKKK